jgi:hypothetical protein
MTDATPEAIAAHEAAEAEAEAFVNAEHAAFSQWLAQEWPHGELTDEGRAIARAAWTERARRATEEPLAKEALASKLIDQWCAAHGKQIPWAAAVEITATLTDMPGAEKARLLALGD